VLNIILSFDYELFFGENTKDASSILFDPTNKIMDVLDTHGVKGTFFVDTLSYDKHKEIGETDYCNEFLKQCTDMIKRGHEAQLHIHAHWIATQYNSKLKRWICDPNEYRLQSYSKDIMEKVIDNGVDFIGHCSESAGVSQKCIAFRAGGLTLTPEKELVELLIKKGFLFDSSVAPYTYSNITGADYDYRHVPSKLNWKISPHIGVNVDANVDKYALTEIPIATIKNNVFRIVLQKQPARIANPAPGGIGFIRNVSKGTLFVKIKNKIVDYHWISLDTRSATLIAGDLRALYRKYDCSHHNYTVALIGHPKMFNQRNVDNLRELIEILQNDNKFQIVSFCDL